MPPCRMFLYDVVRISLYADRHNRSEVFPAPVRACQVPFKDYPPCLDLVEHFLVRQGSLIDVCPEGRHAPNPSRATDRTMAGLDYLHAK